MLVCFSYVGEILCCSGIKSLFIWKLVENDLSFVYFISGLNGWLFFAPTEVKDKLNHALLVMV